ncbi:hypothetical protein BPOR_1534g00010 [Botrytis porri]|uniref:Uncharacterized protein n=1 Tax=Botrytis porri TaxID=87229 RepID=A0A4Z1KBL2_9HELO|nr:hypothetical protein BPOR_1534g00010 [Botrytis porri]
MTSAGGLHGGTTWKSTTGPDSSSSSSTAVPAGVWFSTPHPITIQPLPTVSIVIPSLTKTFPSVTISSGKPKSTKSAEGHGTRNCKIFGCKSHCGLFACYGGCGIFGCSGGCGPLGCFWGDCPLIKCGGLGYVTGCGSSGPDNGGNNNSNNNENVNDDNDCDDPVTALAGTGIISNWGPSPMTEYSSTTKESVACSARDTRTTTTDTTHYPVTTAIMTGFYDIDRTPTNTNYDAIAPSVIEAGLKYYGSLQSTTTTTITASLTASISTVTSIILVTPRPTPMAPRAVCFLHDDTLWLNFR